MPVVSQSIIRPMVPVGPAPRPARCARRTARRARTTSSHDCWAAPTAARRARQRPRRSWARLAVHAQHRSMCSRCRRSRRTGPCERRCGRGGVGVAGHERGDAPRPRPDPRRSRRRRPSAISRRRGWRSRCRAGGTCGWSRRSARSGSRRGRRGSPGGEHDLDRGLERVDVEGVVVVEELQQVEAGQVAAELSRCMYSEHGLEPLMRPVVGGVPALMVVSNCMPGSAHSQAAWRSGAQVAGLGWS
jgi:hypothetical protein